MVEALRPASASGPECSRSPARFLSSLSSPSPCPSPLGRGDTLDRACLTLLPTDRRCLFLSRGDRVGGRGELVPANSTWAQAVPSGYLSCPCWATISARRR